MGSVVAVLGTWWFSAMRIIARRTLHDFVEARAGFKDHAALKAALDAWFHEVRRARWQASADVRKLYATVSTVSAERVVFNIKGNAYLLVVAVDYPRGIVWIKWLGTRIRVSEVLNRKRSLSIRMIRRLHDDLGIAADVLIRASRPPSRRVERARQA